MRASAGEAYISCTFDRQPVVPVAPLLSGHIKEAMRPALLSFQHRFLPATTMYSSPVAVEATSAEQANERYLKIIRESTDCWRQHCPTEPAWSHELLLQGVKNGTLDLANGAAPSTDDSLVIHQRNLALEPILRRFAEAYSLIADWLAVSWTLAMDMPLTGNSETNTVEAQASSLIQKDSSVKDLLARIHHFMPSLSKESLKDELARRVVSKSTVVSALI